MPPHPTPRTPTHSLGERCTAAQARRSNSSGALSAQVQHPLNCAAPFPQSQQEALPLPAPEPDIIPCVQMQRRPPFTSPPLQQQALPLSASESNEADVRHHEHGADRGVTTLPSINTDQCQ